MKRITTLLLAVGLMMQYIIAQVTFSEDIAPIIYNNCTSCHRPGEVGPMSFTNYTEVAAWSGMIQYVTEIKYMPPWKPDKDYSHFIGERGLSDREIQLIADWVAQGSLQGDPSLEPPLPVFPSGSQLGTPDLVLEMAEDYEIEGNNEDDYRVFVLPSGLTEDKEIAAVEFRPGNTKAVHHALIAIEVNGAAAAMDSTSPGYGYEAFGGYGVPTQGSFTGYTPGISPIAFPKGIGTTLPAGADLLLQIHYAPLPTDETDRSLLNIFYKKQDDPIERELDRMPITPFDLVNGPISFRIPPDQITTFEGVKDITEDISLLSVYPHCHYLGQHWELYAVTPSSDTINIIHIEEWDFNWQGAYTFDRMKKIPAGSRIHAIASYDNTTNNPYNPNNPPAMMSWGEGTTDEMFLVGLTFVPYKDGDENIVLAGGNPTGIEPAIEGAHVALYPPFPNPGNGKITLAYYLNSSQYVGIEVMDLSGGLVQRILSRDFHSPGNHTVQFHADKLSPGAYTIRLKGANTVLTRPLIIVD